VIDERAIVTYAQYNEDIVLLALLYDVERGFYIDVGANHPTRDSVTLLFYRRGWRGVNVEPISELYDQLVKLRKRDVNLNCGAGSKHGVLTLREYTKTQGHSTFVDSMKADHTVDMPYRDYDVEIKTLATIINEQGAPHVHFLKIDVEGFEYEVIKGNDWEKYRPEVVCVESNNIRQDWRKILTSRNYALFIFDGLNEFYVAKEAWWRTEGFAERVIALDYNTLKQHQFDAWRADNKHIDSLQEQLNKSSEQINELNQQMLAVGRLSLSGKSMLGRVKRSIYGLTIDWLRYRNQPRN